MAVALSCMPHALGPPAQARVDAATIKAEGELGAAARLAADKAADCQARLQVAMTEFFQTAIFRGRDCAPAAQDAMGYARTVRSSLVRLRGRPCISRQAVSPAAPQVSAKSALAQLEGRAKAWAEDRAMKGAIRNVPAELRGVVSGAISAAREGSLS